MPLLVAHFQGEISDYPHEVGEVLGWFLVLIKLFVTLELNLLGEIHNKRQRLQSSFIDIPHAVVDKHRAK